MRKVLLTPEHSQWWLLSPGVTLYFDELQVLRTDYDAVMASAGKSSYHELVAQNLDSLIRHGQDPVITIVQNVQGLEPDYRQRTCAVVNMLLSIADDTENPALTPREVISLTANAFDDWIAYNKRKARYLRSDEPFGKLLVDRLLPAWEERRNSLLQILEKSPEYEMTQRFRENEQAMSTFGRLISSALMCMDLIDSGHYIHDPMLPEYLPAIALLEGLRTVADYGNNKSVRYNAWSIFNAYTIRMKKYSEVVPLNFSITELPSIVRQYLPIRNALARADETLASICEPDPASAFAVAAKEIAPLVKEAKLAASVVDYGFWTVGLLAETVGAFGKTVGAMGNPVVTRRTGEIAGALTLVRRDVGRFAGAYATMVDSMVISQRTFHHATGYQPDYEFFRHHYWDYGEKSKLPKQ